MTKQQQQTIYEWYQISKQRKSELKELGLVPPPPPPTTAKENAFTETISVKVSKRMKRRFKRATKMAGYRFGSQLLRAILMWALNIILNGGGIGGLVSNELKTQKSTKRATTEEEIFLKTSIEFRGILEVWGKGGGKPDDLKKYQKQWEDRVYEKDILDMKALAIASKWN